MNGTDLNLQFRTAPRAARTTAMSGKNTAPQSAPRSADEEDRRLAKACADFEAIFVEQLFKTMRASVPASGVLDGGRAEEIYTSMMDQQIAQDMARGQSSMGLAQQMHRKLTFTETGRGPSETKAEQTSKAPDGGGR
jgi:flagellar protein FlgJ